MRHIEAVLALEGEEQVVARDAGDVLRLEAEQAADTVILVHDVVADAKVGEGLQGAAEPRVRPGRPLAEDLHVRQQRDPALVGEIEQAELRGKQMWLYDQAAWRATDALLADMDPATIENAFLVGLRTTVAF